jgi:hypothetical protein
VIKPAFGGGVLLALALICTPAVVGAERIPLELHGNLAPVLVAKVDGVNVRLQFDLGNARPLVLQQGVLDAIKAVPTGESARLQGADGFFEAPMFKVGRVEVGTQVFTDVTAVLDVPRKGYQPGDVAQGFLGPGLLKPYQLLLDYSKQQMTLVGPSDPPDKCDGTAVPFSSGWRGEPVTTVQIDGSTATLWWDTGAPSSILSSEFASKMRSPGDSNAVQSTRLILGGTDFGPWRFEVWNISLPGFDGFIGHDFFAKHVVCIDFPQNRVVIGRLTALAPARR